MNVFLLAAESESAPRRRNTEGFMNTGITKVNSAMMMADCELTELVRGHDRDLLERMTPVVERHSVALDLTRVDRIDAAGIAALISLYGRARDAGYGFAVANPTAHVKEILSLVGLDRILLSQQACERLQELTAA
jgi:anti-anti-sigma factor